MMNVGYGMNGEMGIGMLLTALLILLIGFGIGYVVGQAR